MLCCTVFLVSHDYESCFGLRIGEFTYYVRTFTTSTRSTVVNLLLLLVVM